MTLSTNLLVLDPVPVPELFAEARRLLGAGRGVRVVDDWATYWDAGTSYPDKSARVMSHEPGMGLSAWLMVTYAVERPLPTERTVADDIRYECEPYPPHFANLNLDTGYAYKTANGAGCGDLHAWLIRELCLWLEAQNPPRRYRWNDEFTGE